MLYDSITVCLGEQMCNGLTGRPAPCLRPIPCLCLRPVSVSRAVLVLTALISSFFPSFLSLADCSDVKVSLHQHVFILSVTCSGFLERLGQSRSISRKCRVRVVYYWTPVAGKRWGAETSPTWQHVGHNALCLWLRQRPLTQYTVMVAPATRTHCVNDSRLILPLIHKDKPDKHTRDI